jgi:hypothetical protein
MSKKIDQMRASHWDQGEQCGDKQMRVSHQSGDLYPAGHHRIEGLLSRIYEISHYEVA